MLVENGQPCKRPGYMRSAKRGGVGVSQATWKAFSHHDQEKKGKKKKKTITKFPGA
jgi:hypothetical protein